MAGKPSAVLFQPVTCVNQVCESFLFTEAADTQDERCRRVMLSGDSLLGEKLTQVNAVITQVDGCLVRRHLLKIVLIDTGTRDNEVSCGDFLG